MHAQADAEEGRDVRVSCLFPLLSLSLSACVVSRVLGYFRRRERQGERDECACVCRSCVQRKFLVPASAALLCSNGILAAVPSAPETQER